MAALGKSGKPTYLSDPASPSSTPGGKTFLQKMRRGPEDALDVVPSLCGVDMGVAEFMHYLAPFAAVINGFPHTAA